MSSNKNVVRKSKTTPPSSDSTAKISTRRLENEKQDTRKIKKEETKVGVKKLKSSIKNSLTSDVDLKNDVKSVSSSNLVKRTKPSVNTTMKSKSLNVDTPSKRVVKTQYFPSKDMISNVVKGKLKANNSTEIKTKEAIKKSRDSSQIRKRKDAAADKSDDRPKTATLRRSSVLNVNLPEVSSPSPKPSEENYNYEDDFDSYESDFEEYKSSSSSSSIIDLPSVGSHSSSTSSDLNITPTLKINLTDEERKLDSGNYDLNVEPKHKQLLDNIKESVEQENAALSNHTSLSDEGFEDGRSINQANNNSNFINFLDAQKKCIRRKSLAQRKKRGEELLNMIKLDSQNFTLLDIPAISYEDYIKIYGNKSGQQVSSQTNDDNVEETTQTEEEQTINKWTQFPIVISKFPKFNKTSYLMELSGCGTDLLKEENVEKTDYDSNNLRKFLASVEEVVMQLLEKSSGDDTKIEKSELPFSDGFIPIRFNDMSLLENKNVAYVTFSQVDETKFLTVHNSNTTEESLICIWSTIRPIRPEKMLMTYGKVNCCCFGLDNHHIIFGAFAEGTIAIWSLDDSMEFTSEVEECLLVKPNFITGINYGHVAKVVAIQALIDNSDDVWKKDGFETKPSSQICSLDVTGTLIVWSVIVKSADNSHGKNITLIQNSKIVLNEIHANLKDIQCTDMTINLLDLNHIFISTNHGYILHCMINGTKPIPNKYISDKSQSNCLITCPFSPTYFLSAQDNGKIVLYSRSIEKKLKVLEIVDDDVKINMIQWSYTKPFIFYSIDNKNNFYVWDLSNSDLYPTYSIKFKDRVKWIRLSPLNFKEDTWSKHFMIMVTEDNKIDLHLLNAEHGQQNTKNYHEDVKRFLNYINRF